MAALEQLCLAGNSELDPAGITALKRMCRASDEAVRAVVSAATYESDPEAEAAFARVEGFLSHAHTKVFELFRRMDAGADGTGDADQGAGDGEVDYHEFLAFAVRSANSANASSSSSSAQANRGGGSSIDAHMAEIQRLMQALMRPDEATASRNVAMAAGILISEMKRRLWEQR